MRKHRLVGALVLVLATLALATAAQSQDPDKAAQDANKAEYVEGWNRLDPEHPAEIKPGLGSPQRCQNACYNQGTCRAWAYDVKLDSCRLMSQKVEAKKDACCFTGVKPN